MTNPALRKAAILVASLDTPAADALLDGMDPEQAARVRRAVLELDDVDPAEQQRIMSDFLRGPSHRATADEPDVILDPALADKLRAGADAAGAIADRPTAQVPTASFRFLDHLDADQLARVLVREHPQTMSIVLSHLSPPRAAETLRQLPASLQSEVLIRIARLGTPAPEVVRDIEQALRDLLEHGRQLEPVVAQGVAAIGAILQAASGSERQSLLRDLARHDPVLARHFGGSVRADAPRSTNGDVPPALSPQVSPPCALPGKAERMTTLGDAGVAALSRSLTFSDLEHLEDAALAQVLHLASPATSILALAGASHDFVQRILRQLPAREARQLQRKMQQLGPLRLDDVERAQLRLADVAQQLFADGTITWKPWERFAVAA